MLANAFPNNTIAKDLKRDTPQHLSHWLLAGIDPHDVAIMIMRCLVPGYEQAFRLYDRAVRDDVIEPNALKPVLWDYQIEAILRYYGN